MQVKKNPKISLEKKRGLHIQVGLIVALSMVLVSLEWATPELTRASGLEYVANTTIEEDLIQAIPRDKKPEPKTLLPKVLKPVEPDEFNESELGEIPEIDYEYTGEGVPFVFPEEEPEEIVEPLPSVFVEVPAEFPGGEDALMKWIYSNLNYPEECIEHGIEGKVTVKFTISKFGKVTDIEIARGAHKLLDEEVLRVLKTIPDFRPAMQNQQLVPVYMFWPIVFKLQ